MPLKGLESVNWLRIHHSHGSAWQFPEWLNELATDEDEAWEDGYAEDSALNKVSSYSNHQGSVYEVTPYVIPFLNQLLEIVSAQHKQKLLVILTQFAKGTQFPTEDDVSLRKAFEKQGIDFEATIRQAKQSYDDTQARLREGLSLYMTFLDKVDPGIRNEALKLVGVIGWNSTEARQALLALQERETNEKVRTEITNALNPKFDRPGEDDDDNQVYY